MTSSTVRFSRICSGAMLALAAALTACGDDVVPPGALRHLTITGGNDQSGTALDTLSVPLEITVSDDAGNVVAGRAVTWTTPDATGRLIPLDLATNEKGEARARWILGLEPGAQTASASVAGEDDAAEFTAQVSPVTGFKAVALMRGSSDFSGDPHMCALDADGLAWCWGGNYSGKLGDGTTTRSSLPRPVAGNLTFVSIHADRHSTCGLRADGELWCWGQNHYSGTSASGGVFGNGDGASSTEPVRAAQGLLLQDFDMEAEFACGVALDGRAYCWGDGDGAMGDGVTEFRSNVPVEISGERTWREIAVGIRGRCAVSEDDLAYCWFEPDLDRFSWIGVPEEAGPDNTPLPVEIVGTVSDLTLGEYGACGMSLQELGTAICWGYGASDPPPGPATHRLGSSVLKIVADGYAQIALDTDGQLWLWNGTCAAGTGCVPAAGRAAPTLLFTGTEWIDISVSSGIHLISARDSVVFSLGRLTGPVSEATFELKPVPLPPEP